MHSDSFTLSSSRLVVEIAQPGSLYRGTRFDWSAFITQVTLDGKHTFCMPESLEPGQGTGGSGLCNEFGNELAVGYSEAQPGQAFPKLGIGLLKRPDESPYNFFRPYEILENFPIQVETTENRAHFTVEPVECRGVAVRLNKTVQVEDNRLSIDYNLENLGSQTITTHEYCHNFLGIDRHPIGPDYKLHFPQAVKPEAPPPNLYRMAPAKLRWLPKPILNWLVRRYMRRMRDGIVIQGAEIGWRAVPQQAFFTRLQGFTPRREAQWELVYIPGGLCVKEIDDFTPSKLVIWGTSHVVSAEVYTDILIKPGENQRWKREYTFASG